MKMSNDEGKFEREWERAFQNSEIKPPASVWENIESKLDSRRNRAFIPWYKISVAASLLIATSLGIYFGYFNSDEIPNHSELSVTENAPQSSSIGQDESSLKDLAGLTDMIGEDIHAEDRSLSDNNDTKRNIPSGKSILESKDNKTTNSEIRNEIAMTDHPSGDQHDNPSTDTPSKSTVSSLFDEHDYTSFSLDREGNIGLKSPEFTPSMLAEIPEVYRGYDLIEKEDDDGRNGLVAGLNFSTGTFSPNVASTGTNQFSDANFLRVGSSAEFSNVRDEIRSVYPGYDVQQFEELAPSVAFSYGANIGLTIAKRIVIYSGINYTQANTILNSDIVITQNGEVLANSFYSFNGVNSMESTGDGYRIQNGFEFLSIPLKAGYSIIDKEVNVTLLGGVSSEFLLSNSYSSDEPGFNAFRSYLNDGSESLYNPVYFNGLLGVNVGYTFAERYHLYMEPSFRKAISPFTREEFNIQSSPSYKMVMVGLSYRF